MSASVGVALAPLTNDYASVASLTFLLWDVCLTFPDEVAHIWSKSNASYTKWAFLALRYFTALVITLIVLAATGTGALARLHQPPYCGSWYSAQAGALQVVTALMESIMCLRVYALYNRTRTIGIVLLALFVLEETAMATSLALFLPRVVYSEQCIADAIPLTSVIFGVAPVAFEAVLLVLTWARVLRVAKRQVRRELLLVVLVRDGTWTFLAVFLVLGLNGLFYLVIAGPMNSVAWTWQFAISAVAGCRLVLHMHTAGTPHPTLRGTSSAPAPRRETQFALSTFDPGPSFAEPQDDAEFDGSAWSPRASSAGQLTTHDDTRGWR